MDQHDLPSQFDTLAVAAGEDPGKTAAGDVVVPIHLASTYTLGEDDMGRGLEDFDPAEGEFLYSRLSNPTRQALEERLAALENGSHALAFASGSAAIMTLFLSTVSPGGHVVAFDDLYGGTKRMLNQVLGDKLGVRVDFVDATNRSNVEAALRPDTDLVWMETPTNPVMKLVDIAGVAELLADHDAVFGVDNTFLSPYFQNPLDLGADVVAHSTTKYLNGHSDSIGGALVTNDDDLFDELAFMQRVGMGNMLAPFDSYLTLRGIKTLSLRMERHQANAMQVASYLEAHPRVEAVHYPGLESHPQHDLAMEQTSGFGGVLSFELAGDIEDAQSFLLELDEFKLAVSLGGVESLIEHPASMTHDPVPKAERKAIGITDSLLRLSVGVEDVGDLIADLDAAFDAIESVQQPAT